MKTQRLPNIQNPTKQDEGQTEKVGAGMPETINLARALQKGPEWWRVLQKPANLGPVLIILFPVTKKES